MTKQRYDIHPDRPGALIAALPAVLGFVPEHSLVLAAVEDGALGLVTRTDLGDELPDRLATLTDAVSAAAPEAVIAVFVDADGARCPVCNIEFRRIADALVRLLARHDIVVWAAHVVDAIAADGRWHCVDGCGSAGRVEDPACSPLAMAAVLEGRRLYSSRDEMVAVFAPRDRRRRRRLAAALRKQAAKSRAEGAGDSDARARGALEFVVAAVERLSTGTVFDDADLVSLGGALDDIRVRDSLFGLAVGERAVDAEALWVLLAQVLPEPARAEALVLLAFAAYARGDGSLAGMALGAALDERPDHRMAGMLDSALQSGMRPEQIRELAITGLRIAEELGVHLPPQRPARRAG